MPTPFDNLSASRAKTLIADATSDGQAASRAYYNGDHWQGGNGWIGPLPAVTDANSAQVLADIQRNFVARNAIRETVLRHLAGVVGHEPQWHLVVRRALAEGEEPAEQEQALIQEAEALLREWWDWRGGHRLIREAVIGLLLAGRAPLRLFVPNARRNEDGSLPTVDVAESIWYAYAERVPPDQATVYVDQSNMQDVGIYAYTIEDVEGTESSEMVELTYLDDDQTVLRVLGTEQESDPARLALDGALLIHQMEREPLIGEQVRQQQKLLNLAKTMLARNVVVGGFLERVLLNAAVPGTWERDPATGEETFTAGSFQVGAGTTNFFAGVPIVDEQGNTTGYANPSVVYRDPVPVATFVETEQHAYRGILSETRQMHALISGDAAASGESRKQALYDFTMSLMDTAEEVERALRWLLETTLNLAAVFSGEPGRYVGLRVNAMARIDVGPLSADDQRALTELVGARLMSQRTAMARLGIDDPDAEEQQIEQEQEQQRQQARMSLGEAMMQFDRGNSGEGENERA
jgi:hypothetical protein